MPVQIIIQPYGPDGSAQSVGNLLIEALDSGDFDDCLVSVAFATTSGTSRIGGAFQRFSARGGRLRTVCGIANGVTSMQAIAQLHQAGASVFGVDPGPGLLYHPKIYSLTGRERGLLFVGSNNLTATGLFEHIEAAVMLQLNLQDADERQLLAQPAQHLDFLLREHSKNVFNLNPGDLPRFVEERRLRDEAVQRSRSPEVIDDEAVDDEARDPDAAIGVRSPRFRVPPRPAPADGFVTAVPSSTRLPAGAPVAPHEPATTTDSVEPALRSLIIQIRPHHNGEIFLSKTAVDQDRDFFGWPFTGLTVPKRTGNQPYPQRDPDPVVDLRVHNVDGSVAERLNPFNLNTVYYSQKSEIRITVPPTTASRIPQDSILVMQKRDDIDYQMDVYPPQSEEFAQLLIKCDQRMPSGGSATARRFGWLN